MGFAINPPNTRLVDQDGIIDPVWYRFFSQLQKILENDIVSSLQEANYLTYSASPVLLNQRRLLGGTALTLTIGASTASLDLDDTTVTPGTYGTDHQVAQLTVDQQGRLTLASNVAISPSAIGALVAANNLSDLVNVGTARTNLGLGSIATQNSNNVTITGGSVSGITDLAIADGGTGASTAAAARSNLGLVIGTDVQAFDADLSAIAALAGTNTIYYRSGANTWSPVTIGGNLSFSGGTLAVDQALSSGTYTPTISAATNLDAQSVNGVFRYMRVGNIVHGSGFITVDPTATGATGFKLTLPIASNFTSLTDASGPATSTTETGYVFSDDVNDLLVINFTAVTTTSHSLEVSFQYEVL